MAGSPLLMIPASILLVLIGTGYSSAGIILISKGYRDAESGSCCMARECNPFVLSHDSARMLPNPSGLCNYTAEQAAEMGCNGSDAIFEQCSVTHSDICFGKPGGGTNLATGIIGVILGIIIVIVGLSLMTIAISPTQKATKVAGSVSSLGFALCITQIILASIVFHWQINNQEYTFSESMTCGLYISSNCIYYNYAEFEPRSNQTCVWQGQKTYHFGYNILGESLVKTAAVLLFVPVAIVAVSLVGLLVVVMKRRCGWFHKTAISSSFHQLLNVETRTSSDTTKESSSK